MEIKIGDRFKNGLSPTVVEVIDVKYNTVTTKCVVSGRAFDVGDIDHWFRDSLWNLEYLGNYQKASKFEELYNLLNQ